ncbi:SDR family oxidoreductase [Nocardioides sp. ChNu-153]|uniref:SDR family NAD(P)-dependent oxidoreductase n=1 Tax=unclassified Nocardioides TaxID=2615069 RepID=UPI002404D978|nr:MULTISPECIES: SDR family oxidoreductase [unclassified Nocardioides]MDF9717665.1 SDR family oxidoreductase [Nocardioides sp. ChNu-99]MDN7123222.1 SDR family oxidoreductase [Nocardioides sp. ChNu-153]
MSAGLAPGSVVLVTGASSGIGLGVAQQLAAAGHHLVLAARDRAALDRAVESCVRAGAASAIAVVTDVGDDAAVARLVETAQGRDGRLDAVVSCAGVASYGRLEEQPTDVVDGVLRTNLLGSIAVARHALPVLRRQERGTLLFVGSVLGHVATPTMTPYVVSKWGVRALARELQIENRDLPGVRVEYVAPGGVDTPIYANAATTGVRGRPPFPVASAEKTARQVVATLEGRRRASQLSTANHLLRLGFTAAPKVYDAIVTPAFRAIAAERKPATPGPGSVLDPVPDGHDLSGGHGSGLTAVVREIKRAVRGS